MSGEHPTTAQIGEKLLDLLRGCNSAENQTLARSDHAYGAVHEALIHVITEAQPAPFQWPHAMAEEAIQHAMLDGCTLRQAMFAVQAGSGTAINRGTSMNATITEITDELAQRVADAIGEHFVGDRDYWPQVMDADWDGGAGRVIVWSEGLHDWAFLVSEGGESEYAPIEVGPMPLPAGVWVEPVNPQALRVLPKP
ncbi:hypothetical protein AB0B45_02825 [Nonomuraea sp. NPDC049152]|uniref:hypothetical protein n=1 Tax=Nonomuraea sp. NPDC049152 TaxID=3154350 RepID=UPI0033FC6734